MLIVLFYLFSFCYVETLKYRSSQCREGILFCWVMLVLVFDL